VDRAKRKPGYREDRYKDNRLTITRPRFVIQPPDLKRHLTLDPTPDCTLSVGTKKSVNVAAKIGSVAREIGMSIDTIRFYEKEGLVKRPGRSEGGFRLFGPRQIQDLKFIRKSQELGFSLNEIRELLMVRDKSIPSCSHVRELLERR